MMEKQKYDRGFYIFTIACIGSFLLGAFLCRFFHIKPDELHITMDWFMEQTGFYCPGCGGTRSVLYLLWGDFPNAVLYHPVVGYFSLLVLFYFLFYTAGTLSKGRIRSVRFRPGYFYVLIAVLFLQWILKNYFVWSMQVYIIPI